MITAYVQTEVELLKVLDLIWLVAEHAVQLLAELPANGNAGAIRAFVASNFGPNLGSEIFRGLSSYQTQGCRSGFW